jgi:4-hydroxy-tetrahydrodipicolinate reductase
MHTIILGDGGFGLAVESALLSRPRPTGASPQVRLVGRPPSGQHAPSLFARTDLVVEASRGDAVLGNLTSAVTGGVRRAVIATTGWLDDRDRVEELLIGHGAAAVAAPNFSLGVAIFGRLVDVAVELLGPLDDFDPYLLEWHRRSKRDRPSGTALALGRRIVERHPCLGSLDDLEVTSIRAGSAPGMHLVGFDAPGETIELRLTARDRSAYAAGALLAADWLMRSTRAPGLHPFEPIVDELIVRRGIAA